MTMKPNGGPAYPTRDFWDENESRKHEHGMSLRDWFAGQCVRAATDTLTYDEGHSAQAIARATYELADAMIAEREK